MRLYFLKRVLVVVALLLGVLGLSSGASPSMVAPLDLKEISKEAEIVFRGLCTEAKSSRITHPKTGKELPVVTYLFTVKESVKGDAGGSLEVKLLGFKTRREAFQIGYYGPLQTESLEVGKEYLLFLGPVNVMGVRSLMGDGDGKYLIERDAQGKATVKSRWGMGTGPGAGKALQKGSPQPVFYEEFKKGVQKLLQE